MPAATQINTAHNTVPVGSVRQLCCERRRFKTREEGRHPLQNRRFPQPKSGRGCIGRSKKRINRRASSATPDRAAAVRGSHGLCGSECQ